MDGCAEGGGGDHHHGRPSSPERAGGRPGIAVTPACERIPPLRRPASRRPGGMNTLYYGDNLDILRRYVKDETVDLVYLDPPFKSNQDYNVLFAEQDGTRSTAQIMAFEDTWRWDH